MRELSMSVGQHCHVALFAFKSSKNSTPLNRSALVWWPLQVTTVPGYCKTIEMK